VNLNRYYKALICPFPIASSLMALVLPCLANPTNDCSCLYEFSSRLFMASNRRAAALSSVGLSSWTTCLSLRITSS